MANDFAVESVSRFSMLSPANAAEVRFLHSLLHPEGHFKKPTLCKYRAWRCSVMDCPGTYQRLLGATFNLRTHTHTLVRILFQTDTYELASRHGAAAGGQQGTIDSVAPASTCRVMVAEAVHDPVEQWTRQESWRRLETLMGSAESGCQASQVCARRSSLATVLHRSRVSKWIISGVLP